VHWLCIGCTSRITLTMDLLSPSATVYCLGRNFAAHARELNYKPPSSPIWFNKLKNVFVGDKEPIIIPSWLDSRVDCEAEVAIRLGVELHNATLDECEAAISHFTCANDITARKVQITDRDCGLPWMRSKNLSSFGSIGPAWHEYPGFGDFSKLELIGSLNGQIVQQALLGEMLFSPGQALSEMSRWHKLFVGDVLLLGTPKGVSPINDGDTISVSCGDACLTNHVSRA